uniref:Uncharacterized protein n=1 Tax=Emiliania huxleyi TaxID=2903 RepID=A0A7S3SQZ3_EMIHU
MDCCSCNNKNEIVEPAPAADPPPEPAPAPKEQVVSFGAWTSDADADGVADAGADAGAGAGASQEWLKLSEEEPMFYGSGGATSSADGAAATSAAAVGEAAAEAAAAAAAGEVAGEAEAEMFPSDQYPGNLRIDAASEVRAELAAFNKWNNGEWTQTDIDAVKEQQAAAMEAEYEASVAQDDLDEVAYRQYGTGCCVCCIGSHSQPTSIKCLVM